MHQGSAALLFEFLRSSYEIAGPPAASPVSASFILPDPYLLASLVQKSIRRGNLNVARRAAHQLHSLDRQRLWRRLAVTALEDIGTANIQVAAQVTAIASIPAARRLFGDELTAIDHALAVACGSIKDRTADHFCSVAGREPMTPEDKTLLGQASPNALFAVLASSGQTWVRRLHAAIIVSGRTECPPYQPDSTEALFEIYRELGVPELLMGVCTVYATRQRDLLPVLVPLTWLLHAEESASSAISHSLAEAEPTGDMPTYAFDPVNTRLGRRAVDLFLRAHIARPVYSPRLVAAAIWNAESALCDRTLDWITGAEIRQRAYTADLAYRGLAQEQHAALNAWIAAELPALTAARQAVWNNAVKGIGKSVEGPEQAILPLPVPERWSRRG